MFMFMTGRILSVTAGHYDSQTNRKTIVQFEEYKQNLRSGSLYPRVKVMYSTRLEERCACQAFMFYAITCGTFCNAPTN